MPECCVSDCKSGRKKTAKNPEPEKVQMFLFPTETTARNRWLIQCGLGKNLSQSARICAKHFLESCFLSPSENVDNCGRPRARLRLKDDAVPTEFRFGPSPISYKRKIINSETAEDTNLEVKPNVLKKPVKSEFNEHGYCYNNTLDKDSEKKTVKVLEASSDPGLSKIKVPGAKKVRVMKVTKQSNGQLLCEICSGVFEDVNGAVKHMPYCEQESVTQ